MPPSAPDLTPSKLLALAELEVAQEVLSDVGNALLEALAKTKKEFFHRLNSAPRPIDLSAANVERREIDVHFELTIPSVLAKSMMVYSFSLVEASLLLLAGDGDSRRGPPHRNGKRRSPIDRAKAYFSEVIGLDVSTVPGWEVLREFQELRHAVVHRSGRVGSGAKAAKLQKLAARFPDELTVLDWDDVNAELLFDCTLCERFITISTQLVSYLADTAASAYRETDSI